MIDHFRRNRLSAPSLLFLHVLLWSCCLYLWKHQLVSSRNWQLFRNSECIATFGETLSKPALRVPLPRCNVEWDWAVGNDSSNECRKLREIWPSIDSLLLKKRNPCGPYVLESQFKLHVHRLHTYAVSISLLGWQFWQESHLIARPCLPEHMKWLEAHVSNGWALHITRATWNTEKGQNQIRKSCSSAREPHSTLA